MAKFEDETISKSSTPSIVTELEDERVSKVSTLGADNSMVADHLDDANTVAVHESAPAISASARTDDGNDESPPASKTDTMIVRAIQPVPNTVAKSAAVPSSLGSTEKPLEFVRQFDLSPEHLSPLAFLDLTLGKPFCMFPFLSLYSKVCHAII